MLVAIGAACPDPPPLPAGALGDPPPWGAAVAGPRARAGGGGGGADMDAAQIRGALAPLATAPSERAARMWSVCVGR